jgi:hypothetical protein
MRAPHREDREASGRLKAFILVALAVAVVIGLLLPIPHKTHARPQASKFATFDIAAG